MSDTVQAIKEKLHIADVLKDYIQIIPAGKNMKALCPFHKEKSPSFMISPDREMWYCFGCAEGGDMFKFLMKFENVEFFEAMKILADKAGVEVRSSLGASEASRELYDINRVAKDFYMSALHGTPGAHRDLAVQYLKDRGLVIETIKEFEIGLAPTSSDSLLRHLISQRKDISDIDRSGVVFKSDRGTYWDRFRNRLMFPLYNGFGKVIGFTGRILPDESLVAGSLAAVGARSGFDGAKYVNSPETPIFNKSKLLYGFHKSKSHIRDKNAVIVVEGQMDFLMMWQDGIRNVVASSGTALTAEHLSHLRRLADTLLLCFDSDEAGQNAAERSIDLANSLDFNVKLIEIGAGLKDPADVVKSSPGKMAEIIKSARPVFDWYFDRYLKGVIDIASRKKGVRVILEKIKRIASSVEREQRIRDLSLLSGISEFALREDMASIVISAPSSSGSGNMPPLITSGVGIPARKPIHNKRDLISERILSLVCADPKLKVVIEPYKESLSPKHAILLSHLSLEGFKDVPLEFAAEADLISLKSSFGTNPEIDEFNILIRELRKESLRQRSRELLSGIAELEMIGADSSKLVEEFGKISKELHG